MDKPISLCDRCDIYMSCLLNYDGPACRRNRTVEPTNADRIRAMTDEELAAFLNPVTCRDCPIDDKSKCGKDGVDCGHRILDWLRKAADE